MTTPIASSGRPNAGPALLVLAGILLFALLLRTQRIEEVTLTFDEACSWKISGFPWSEMLDAISRDAHPPVFYAVLKGWGAIAGEAPAAMRSLTVGLGLATIVAAYVFVLAAGRWATTDSSAAAQQAGVPGRVTAAALLAALLVAISGLHVDMSLQARPYTLGTLLALMSATCLLRALHPSGRARDWAAFALTAGLLSLTHYYCLWTMGAEFLFAGGVLLASLARTRWSAETRRLALGMAGAVWGVQSVWSLWLPVFLDQRARSTQQLWMRPLTAEQFTSSIGQALGGGRLVAPPEWALAAVATWAGAALGLLAFGGRGARLAALCALVPPVAVIAYALLVRNILGTQYLIFGQLFVLIGLAWLATAPRRVALRVALAVAVCLWFGQGALQHAEARERLALATGLQTLVQRLELQRRPGEPVVVGSPFVHPLVQHYSRDRTEILSRYYGRHEQDLLGGPPLRRSEFENLDRAWDGAAERVWTVDVYDLFGAGSRFEAHAPGGWACVSEETFREASGLECVLVLREHQRRPSAMTGQSAPTNPATAP
ncbi:MAG: glycosyltransferase family 39 protein [Planctomyces sp.]|nr:glycosyltransferase family 39 protein [Planctomyces sp.]